MTALGTVKIREEADPFSMDLGNVEKGGTVKVLETSKLWVRVCYRGREDGWVLTANKRGPMLAPSEDPSAAAQVFHTQEAAFLETREKPQDGGVGGGDRPLTGAKPPSVASGAVVAEEDR
ncbi:unnamed protein product, partial [Laminaria digitata]